MLLHVEKQSFYIFMNANTGERIKKNCLESEKKIPFSTSETLIFLLFQSQQGKIRFNPLNKSVIMYHY